MTASHIITDGLGIPGGLVSNPSLLLNHGLMPREVILSTPSQGRRAKPMQILWTARVMSLLWRAQRGSAMASDQVIKQPSEVATFYFDFSPKLQGADLLTGSAAITTAGQGLTIGASAILVADVTIEQDGEIITLEAGKAVAVQLSAGLDRENYRLECICSTVNGNTLEVDGVLQVRDR